MAHLTGLGRRLTPSRLDVINSALRACYMAMGLPVPEHLMPRERPDLPVGDR